MRRSKTSIAGIAAAACVALLWVFFGPPQLGGSTSYTATVGNSMEPLFHEGDLALTRPASSYRVGDIVLYMSPVFHRPVLHRILAIQHDHYFFKGDHNTFVDPGYATRHELLGKLWYRVPNAGKVVGWFGKPSHAAVMGAIAALVLLLGGSRQVRRRRRGRRRRTQDRRPPVLSTTIRRNLHGPRKSAENIFAMAAFAAAIVLLTVGFTTPLKKTVPLANAYTQSGTFSYTGKAIRRDAAYPTGTVEAPQPVFIANFKMLTVGFRYHFSSSLPHGVRGTIALKARLSSDAVTWHNSYVLVPPRPFSGDQASVSGTFELAQLGKLIQQLVTDSGVVSSEYGAEVIPIVHYTGVVRGHPVSGSYSPILALKISANVLTVESTSPAALPGATYTPESSGSSSLATLNPVQPGSIPAYAPTYAKLARYSLPTSLVRGIGLALIALALLVPFTKPLRHRRREVWSLEKRIAHHFDCVIVDVLSLDGIARTTGVATFTALATLARYSERPILHATIGDREEYAVEDGGALYVYRVEERGDEAEPMPTPRVTPTPTAARPRRRFRLALLSLVVLAVCATLVTALTAGNTVPPSYANASTHATQVSELAPGQCASLALTRLLIATTSSTTGTTASELLLGKNGSTTLSLNGGGGDDCLVGGGGVGTTNKFDGGPGTNICIGPAAATNTFSHCSQTYTS